MSEKNILMKQNTPKEWVTLYPITKSENVKTKTGNLQQDLDRLSNVGGRNLISATNLQCHADKGQIFEILPQTYRGIPIIEMIVNGLSTQLHYGWRLKENILINADKPTFTLSFYYKVLKYVGSETLYGYIYQNETSKYYMYTSLLADPKIKSNLDKWFKAEFTFNIDASITALREVYFFFNDAGIGTHVLATLPKLEFGNVATDYSLAEGDIKNMVDNKICFGKKENPKSSVWFCEV